MAGELERRFSAQDGTSLFYRDWPGPGGAAGRTPLLCLAGLSRNSRDFRFLAERECRRRRVVALDYRGRGRSEPARDWHSYNPWTYLGDIGQLLAVAGLQRVCVVGTSLGGFLAIGLGVTNPAALAGVVLNDAGPGIALGTLAKLLDYIGHDDPQPDVAAATAHLQALFGREIGFRDEATWRQFAENSYRPGDDGLLHVDWDTRIVEPMKRRGALPDLWALWRGLARIPTLAIRGGASPLLSAEAFRSMGEGHTCLTRLEVAGLGHAPSLEEPEVLDAMEVFLAELDRREGFI
ncbi:Pimeloyl-ACP methyl ester carboxylesterase [Tistlia consotensis]|uniref:Pimeloyl-ACP methyl ester carboxylesterase n=1 Tax=Tistlia consotensis USBA 355 TaxID=560819 RepID=A0A1Y6BM83_9PROT|nr:alpha/beta hydrolase [Tistlia consotensis]SMF18453.1 Pimeloyl-ACP methyl ester carboxylesterase [Tistlia consotensis USBA 355]SNR39676.1 Pimeloyl-ACP methyl ester carboxylesterase [Tistlia consotensis]